HVAPSGGGVSAYLRDVTADHRSREAEKRLAAILEATPDFVASADLQGPLHYVNTAGQKMMGLGPPDDAPPQLTLGSSLTETAARRVLDHGVPEALRHGVWVGETAIRNHGGSGFTQVSQVILAHRDAEGRPQSLSTIARDITDRKRLEEAQRFLV